MKKWLGFPAVFFFVCFINVAAQIAEMKTENIYGQCSVERYDSLQSAKPAWHEFVTNIPSDIGKYLKYTFRDNKIFLYTAIGMSTAVLVATDDDTYKSGKIFYNKSSFNKNISEFFTELGDGRTQFIMSAVFAAYGLIGNDTKALRTGSQIAEAVLASGLIAQVIKHITGRESPSGATTPTGKWRLFPNQREYHKHVADYDAFPSGHLTTSVATVEVIAENYPSWWIRPIGYSICAGIAFGMVNKGIHWHSDYPLAIALGYTFGQIIAHPEGINDIAGFRDSSIKVSVFPSAIPSGMALNITAEF